ncbi:MAG: hypothetical protein IPO92_23725 [Saprospiraceae bacterium]|nr:hypothetical protein [Saprospiraceae bacterium]
MKVSFPSDFTCVNVPLSTAPVSVNARVFRGDKEDFVRETTNDQNGGGFFSIGGYHALNAYIFNSQGQFAGLVMGEKNGRAILRDVSTISQAILNAMAD